MSDVRRSAKDIDKNIEQCLGDIKTATGEIGLKRTELILKALQCSLLLDIREHLDGIECRTT